MNSINNRNEFNKDKGTRLGKEEHFHFKEKIIWKLKNKSLSWKERKLRVVSWPVSLLANYRTPFMA